MRTMHRASILLRRRNIGRPLIFLRRTLASSIRSMSKHSISWALRSRRNVVTAMPKRRSYRVRRLTNLFTIGSGLNTSRIWIRMTFNTNASKGERTPERSTLCFDKLGMSISARNRYYIDAFTTRVGG